MRYEGSYSNRRPVFGIRTGVMTAEDHLDIYRERSHLLAHLATCYPSVIAEPTDAEPGFQFALFIETPQGQLSWHISDNDLDCFDGIVQSGQATWDGHTTEQKYKRLIRLAHDRAQEATP